MNSRNEDTRCKSVTKRGEPCRAAATASGLCFFHANPNKASELGRIGGRRNRHVIADMVDPLPAVVNEFSVRDIVARLVADVYVGKIHPKRATTLTQLLNLQLRSFSALDQAQKIFVERRYTWRRTEKKSETSTVEKPESSKVPTPDVSSVERPENSSSVSPEISSVRESDSPRAGKSGISKETKPEITGGSWEVMGNLDEPEVSSEEESKISSAAKATISREGRLEVVSAGSAAPPIRNNPVFPTEETLALKRERERAIERETLIQLAMASSLSDGFGLDES
jgi:hypothetical protein